MHLKENKKVLVSKNKSLNEDVKKALKLYFKSLIPEFSNDIEKKLNKQIINFANLSNFIALKGGAIKQQQYLSKDIK